MRRRPALLLALLLALPWAPLPATSAGVAAPLAQTADGEPCSPGDRPETGVQGQVPVADQLSGRSQQGYWCNLRPVSALAVPGRGGDTQMTWFGHCAYRAVKGPGGDGVAVLDVRDPRRPRLVTVLQDPRWAGQGPVLGIHEGLHVSERRALLAVPAGTTLTTYDVRDCTRPRPLGHVDLGLPPGDTVKSLPGFDDGIHSGKLSADGTLYYATDLGNGALVLTGPCLTVVDLRDPRRMSVVARHAPDTPCHDLSLSPDGRRAYVGWYAPTYGHPVAVAAAFGPAAAASERTSGLRVLDVSEVQAHRPDPQVRVLGELDGGRQHTETHARIKGRDYVIAGEEGFCPGGNGRIVDVTDPAAPVAVAELPLAINQAESCAVNRADTDNALLLYMTHYISVDDPREASLVFVTWYGAGLRVFDIRDPTRPREVAYLNPAVGPDADTSHDISTTYPRYVPTTGQVWFGSATTGFQVVELAPHLRPGARRARWSVPPQPLPPTAPGPLRLDLVGSVEARFGGSDEWFCTSALV